MSLSAAASMRIAEPLPHVAHRAVGEFPHVRVPRRIEQPCGVLGFARYQRSRALNYLYRAHNRVIGQRRRSMPYFALSSESLMLMPFDCLSGCNVPPRLFG